MSQGLVIYTDGGVRGGTNPGYGGFGAHGYLYKYEFKKEAGNQNWFLTELGYVTKKDYDEKKSPPKVEPIHYVNCIGSFGHLITNNVAEMHGLIHAMQHALEYDIDQLAIFADSRYVVDGLNDYLKGWLKNGWLRRDGQPVANIEFWKQIHALREQLLARNVKFSINWVKAHHEELGNIGNVIADSLATIAVFHSMDRQVKVETTVTPASGYWKYDNDRHPMISLPRMYFNTLEGLHIPGRYYIGNHGKDDELIGKRISDGAMAVVQIDPMDAILEKLVTSHREMAGAGDNLIMVRLDQLYRSDVHRNIVNYGKYGFVRVNPNRMDTECLDKEPLGKELNPVKLGFRAVESLTFLEGVMDSYFSGTHSYVETDITEILYATETKKVKKEDVTVQVLKPEYNVGYASLEVDVNYKSEDEIKNAKVTLTLGIDMLHRNSLKQLETLNPRIVVVTWLEAPGVFRYATIVDAGANRGIYCGVYSNLRIVS